MVTEDQRAEVTSYLHAQAAKLSTEELLAKRKAEVERLLATAAGLTEDEARWAPDGEWSTVQILQHVLASLFPYRQSMARTGLGYELEGAPPAPPTLTIAALSAAIRDEHEETQRLLRELDGAPTERTEDSELFGELNWREWALFERVHLLDHVNQIRALKEGLDTPGR